MFRNVLELSVSFHARPSTAVAGTTPPRLLGAKLDASLRPRRLLSVRRPSLPVARRRRRSYCLPSTHTPHRTRRAGSRTSLSDVRDRQVNTRSEYDHRFYNRDIRGTRKDAA